jgi:ABC-type multidrug transport system fused ATPase/permease subunit
MKNEKPPKISLRRYLRLRRYATRYLDIQIAMMICGLLSGFGGLIGPYITKLTFDYAYGNRDWYLLLALAGAGFIMALLSQVGGNVQSYLSLYASQNLSFAMRSDFLRHLYNLPLSFFQKRSTGEILYRLGSDVSGTSDFLGNIINSLVNPVFSTVYPLIGIIILDWRFALVALVAAPFFALHSRYFGKLRRNLSRLTMQESQRISSEATDRIAQVKLVKSFGREKREIREYLSNQIRLMRLGYRQYWINLWSSLSSGLLVQAGQTALGLYLGYRVIVTGDMTLGTLIAVTMYLTQLIGAVNRLAGIYPGLLNQLVPVDRVLDILEIQDRIQEPPDAIAVGPLDGALSLRNVSFGYTPENPVLQGADLDIIPGTFVAIVGPSGAGKTTILNLLLRLYDPLEGEVLIDGKPLHHLRLAPLRAQIGVALQETFLFNGTIRENILYGNPEAKEAELREAAGLADADDFILALPEGYATKVGESGCLLSAGQRQRIGIARALVRHPRLLILDEATASLSLSSEAKILRSLRPRSGELTLVVVTHRLSAIRNADQIYVLDGGKVAEQGIHEDLLARHGLYYELWQSQFGAEPESHEALEVVGGQLA